MNIRYSIFFIVLLLINSKATAQIGIGAKNPHGSAALDITSITKGFLPPRMSVNQIKAIANPAQGLLVFCTDCTVKTPMLFDGVAWVNMSGLAIPNNNVPPVITSALTVYESGTSVTLSSTNGIWSSAPTSYTYQWQLNGTNISGATNTTYTSNFVANTTYTCIVKASNEVSYTSVSSNNLTLSNPTILINTPPHIVSNGTYVQRNVDAIFSNATSVTYQWTSNGAIIPGATSSNLELETQYWGTSIICMATAVNNNEILNCASNALTPIPILETVPGAQVAVSLRKLSSTYTGRAIKVRRSSDNTTQDIGFTANGQLDVTALTTFVGAGDGFVDTWYDQSGNGRDVVNVTLTAQPKIVSSGVVNTQNGKPAVLFTTTSQLFSSANATWLHNTPQTFFSVTKDLTGNGYIAGTEYNGNGNYLGLGIPNGFMKVQFFFNDGAWGVNQAIPNSLITTLLFTAPGSSGYINGTFVGGSTGPSGTGLTAAKKYIVGQSVTMSLNEIIHYASVLSTTNRSIIEKNQGRYYGVVIP